MKRKILVLAVLCVLIAASTCYAANAGVTAPIKIVLERTAYEEAEVIASRLNVREGPSTDYPAICKLEKGQTVTVMGKLGDWYAIYNPDTGVVGAVDGRYIEFGSKDSINVSANNALADMSAARKLPSTKDKDKDGNKETFTLSEDEQKLLDIVNKARKEKGLEALAVDEKLMKVARTKAKDMVDNNYFSHQSPTYGSPFDMMRQFDNVFKCAGENIAGNKSVEGAFKAWMGSDSHKKNILNPAFQFTGIGIENSSTYGKVFVQQFIGK